MRCVLLAFCLFLPLGSVVQGWPTVGAPVWAAAEAPHDAAEPRSADSPNKSQSSPDDLFERAVEARRQGDVPTARRLTREAADAGHADAAYAVALWTYRRSGWDAASDIHRLSRLGISRSNHAHAVYFWLAASAERLSDVASAEQVALWYRLAAADLVRADARGLAVYEPLATLNRHLRAVAALPIAFEDAIRWTRRVYGLGVDRRIETVREICARRDLDASQVLCHTLLFDLALQGEVEAQNLVADSIVALPAPYWRQPAAAYLHPAQWWLCRAAVGGDAKAAVGLADFVRSIPDADREIEFVKLARLLHQVARNGADGQDRLNALLDTFDTETLDLFMLRKDAPVEMVLC